MSFRRSGCGCRKCCMPDEQPAQLTASEAVRRIDRGVLSSEELVQSCLECIRALEPTVRDWTFLDEEHALAQAHAADESRRSGEPVGALNGIPVGVKDIMDTADMPTENGTVLDKGRMPRADAAVVARLRAAGGVIMGKTVSTECAYFTPGKTRNPHNPEHTPGGSSSGSAASVAAHMVPLALGSQTAGSVIRPAAFCGVYGFKPTHGLIPRTGVLQLSRTLDHIGLFARSIDDLALLAEELTGYDDGDPDTRPLARIPFSSLSNEEPPIPPTIAFIKTPHWERVDELFMERYDAILTPPALGTAPKGLGATGDPVFCVLWTLLGMPAVTLPLMQGANGLPLGVQLVGRRNFDARLLRTARWLEAKLASS